MAETSWTWNSSTWDLQGELRLILNWVRDKEKAFRFPFMCPQGVLGLADKGRLPREVSEKVLAWTAEHSSPPLAAYQAIHQRSPQWKMAEAATEIGLQKPSVILSQRPVVGERDYRWDRGIPGTRGPARLSSHQLFLSCPWGGNWELINMRGTFSPGWGMA